MLNGFKQIEQESSISLILKLLPSLLKLWLPWYSLVLHKLFNCSLNLSFIQFPKYIDYIYIGIKEKFIKAFIK